MCEMYMPSYEKPAECLHTQSVQGRCVKCVKPPCEPETVIISGWNNYFIAFDIDYIGFVGV